MFSSMGCVCLVSSAMMDICSELEDVSAITCMQSTSNFGVSSPDGGHGAGIREWKYGNRIAVTDIY